MEYKWVILTVTAVGTLMSGINMRVVIIDARPADDHRCLRRRPMRGVSMHMSE
jgi:hypothetical protein